MPYFEFQNQRLFYREQGTGQPLRILHGNTASSVLHQGEMEYFASRYRVIALDALGCGQSTRVEKWSVEWWRDYAFQAGVLLAHLHATPAIVMGTSGGALAALWMAGVYHQLVKAVIADSFVRHEPPDHLRKEVHVGRAERSPGQIAFWTDAHGADWEQVVDADSQMLLLRAFEGGNLLAGCPLESITCPVLITVSRQDDLLPNVEKETFDILPYLKTSRVYLHHEGGHPLMWSQPTVFRGMVDAFLHSLNLP